MPLKDKKEGTEPISPDEAVLRLERFCAYQDRYTSEIVQKLKQFGLDPTDADIILQYLIEEKYIDDGRYADAFVRGKVRQNHWGLIKVKHALRAKGIDTCYIDAAVKHLPEAEYLHILEVELQKRWSEARGQNTELRKLKAIQSTIRAGFEPDLVFEAAKRLLS